MMGSKVEIRSMGERIMGEKRKKGDRKKEEEEGEEDGRRPS